MILKQVTYPNALPVSLSDMKAHLAVEADENAFNNLISDQIRAAAEYIYIESHLALINTQYTAYWDCFPSTPFLRVPLWPVVSIDSLKYYDPDGDEQTYSGYQTDLVSCPSRIALNQLVHTWPYTASNKLNAVSLTFTAGYGSGSETMPNLAKHAIKMMVAHWFRNRETVITGTITKEIEHASSDLMRLISRNEFEEFAVQ